MFQHLLEFFLLSLVATVEGLRGGLGQLEASDVVELEHLQHLLGLGVDLDDVLLQGGHVGHVIVATFALLFLQLDGDAANLGVTQALHQMRDKTGMRNKLVFHLDNERSNSMDAHPAILFLKGFVGMIATSSTMRLLVWKSNVKRV